MIEGRTGDRGVVPSLHISLRLSPRRAPVLCTIFALELWIQSGSTLILQTYTTLLTPQLKPGPFRAHSRLYIMHVFATATGDFISPPSSRLFHPLRPSHVEDSLIISLGYPQKTSNNLDTTQFYIIRYILSINIEINI